MFVVPELYQSKNQTDDKYSSMDQFNYQSLGNASTISDDDSEKMQNKHKDLEGAKIVQSSSDQKLPFPSSFAYVNKYGLAKTEITPPKKSVKKTHVIHPEYPPKTNNNEKKYTQQIT